MTRLRPALVVFVLLTFIGLVSCESSVDAPAEQPLSAETKRATDVLPSGAAFVSMANAQVLLQEGDLPTPGDLGGGEGAARVGDFLETAGFDPARDVQDVYIARTEGGAMSFAAYVSVDRAKMQQAIEEQMSGEWARSDYGGLPVYTHEGEGDAFAFTLANDDLILAATKPDALRGMIDRLTGDGSPALADDAALMPLVRKVQGQGDAWFALRGVDGVMNQASAQANAPDGGMSQQIGQLRRAVRDAAASFTLSGNRIEGTAYLTAAPDVDPADLANVVEGAVAALKASPETDAPQRQALNDVRVAERGDEVTVAFALPTSVMERGRGPK